MVRLLPEEHRQRARERAARQAVRHGAQRVGGEREYPLARTTYRRCISRAAAPPTAIAATAGSPGTSRPTAPPSDRYRYDPDDPVPSVGGNNCCGAPTCAGPQDQRPIESAATSSSTPPTSSPRSWRSPARSRWCCTRRRTRWTRTSSPSSSTSTRTARATTWPKGSCAPATGMSVGKPRLLTPGRCTASRSTS